MSKNRLGGGAASLLGGFPLIDSGTPDVPIQLAIDSIKPNPHQPRKHFDEEGLKGLTQSIVNNGVIQPIIVVKEGIQYVLVAGERRLRAAKQAGLPMIPVLVREFTPLQQAEIALLENIQREDLRPIEAAKAYQQLLELRSYSHDDLAIRLGVSRSTVTNTLRLLKLNDAMQVAVDLGTMSAGHARALLAIDNEEARQELFDRICTEGFSVRQAEQWRSGTSTKEPNQNKKPRSEPPKVITQRTTTLAETLGVKVLIKGDAQKGTLALHYDSAEKLHKLLSLLESNNVNKKDGLT